MSTARFWNTRNHSMQVPCHWHLLVRCWHWNICPRPHLQHDSGELWLEERLEAGRINVVISERLLKYHLWIGHTRASVVLAFWLVPQCCPWQTLGVRPLQRTPSITMEKTPRRRRQTKFGNFYLARTLHQAKDYGTIPFLSCQIFSVLCQYTLHMFIYQFLYR